MNILVLNCGSSSLKYKIIRMPDEQEIITGEAERVGIKTAEISTITHYTYTEKRIVKVKISNHIEALQKALELINEDHVKDNTVFYNCFAHRYVNAGIYFQKSSRINPDDLTKLKSTFGIAPLHNPICFQLIEYCNNEYSDIPQYIVTDNAFHSTIPKDLATYALPLSLIKKYNLKRMGYHGISHKYVMEESFKYLGKDPETLKIISCHLGTGGSSICAIKYGKSINSSMGFTPLEGLIMNTRSGDVDLGLIFYMMYNNKLSSQETEKIFNKQSGILSIFRKSSDLRDAIENMASDKLGERALDMYIRRIKKYIGYYVVLLQKADVLIFTDSLGVGVPVIRNMVCKGLEFFGIKIDPALSNNYKDGIADISYNDSETRILIIPNDEELMIARDAYQGMSKVIELSIS